MTLGPIVHSLYEAQTGTWQYVVGDAASRTAVVIDPVLNFEPASATVTTTSADEILSLIKTNEYFIERILETHVHADHLTAAGYLRAQLRRLQKSPPRVCIGKRIKQVQERFAKKYNIAEEEWEDAFDQTFDDDEIFRIGGFEARALHLPGHSPDHLGYMIESNVFCGDSLFNSDVGSARCDFPGGDPHSLYQSAQKLLALPDEFKIWTGHDYPPDGSREALPYQTVGDQKKDNKHLKEGTAEADFVQWRGDRDSGLKEPRLIHQALQFNIRAGKLPAASGSGDRFLHVPIKLPNGDW